MKKLLLILSIFLTLASCDEIDRFTYVPPIDIEEDLDNPADPESPYYQEPEASITGGPAEGETITDRNDVTFVWTGSKSGSGFKYMLEGVDSEYKFTSSNSKDYSNLANGNYRFNVKEIDSYGVEQVNPTQRNFSVNYNGGTSQVELVFAESSMNMTYGSSYDLAVEVNNISNLSGIKIVIQFEPYYLSVNSLQQGDFFAESDNIAFLNEFDNNNGRIEIDMSALGLDNGKTGSGVLARINLLAQNTGTTSLNFLQGEMIIRDASNNDISIQSFGSCTISIN